MPFTPFHLGPGLLLKSAVGRMSFGAFTVAQVAIDLEPAYRLATGTYPLHGWTHTLVGASALGIGAAFVSVPLLRYVNDRLAEAPGLPRVFSRPTTFGAVLGGLLGGVTHVLLDMLVHWDVRPLWPFATLTADVVSDATM